jgi:hypothetical protein
MTGHTLSRRGIHTHVRYFGSFDVTNWKECPVELSGWYWYMGDGKWAGPFVGEGDAEKAMEEKREF